MSDGVMTTLIAAGSGLLGVLFSFLFSLKTTTRTANLSARQAQWQWEQLEARRRDEVQIEDRRRKEDQRRADARHQQENRSARLRECWEYVLATRDQMQKLRKRLQNNEEIDVQQWPTATCGRACAVALIELPEIYWLVKDLHEATLQFEVIAVASDLLPIGAGWYAWDKSFIRLEKAVTLLLGVTPAVQETEPDAVIRATRRAAQNALDALESAHAQQRSD